MHLSKSMFVNSVRHFKRHFDSVDSTVFPPRESSGALGIRGFQPIHRTGTARAGASPENSVCTSDFDCHDIDNLLFTSAAVVPRTFFWSMAPTSVNATYAWRRMIANHFSTGSSTKGFA